MNASPDIFLSYSRDDQAVARLYAQGLEREGFSVWWDQTLRSGEAYDEVTEQALKSAKVVLVLMMLEPCDRPVMFELTQTADLSGWAWSRTGRNMVRRTPAN